MLNDDLPPRTHDFVCRRAIMHMPTLLARHKFYSDENNAILYGLREHLRSLPLFIGLDALLTDLERRLTNIRKAITPDLRYGGVGVYGRLRWLGAFARIRAVNSLDFEVSRLRAEAPWDNLRFLAEGELGSLVRGHNTDFQGDTLLEDCQRELQARIGHLHDQLAVIRDAFRTHVDYGLQRVGIALTLVGLLLAIPEAWRAKLITKLWTTLCSFITAW
jgi:hypothetical protein